MNRYYSLSHLKRCIEIKRLEKLGRRTAQSTCHYAVMALIGEVSLRMYCGYFVELPVERVQHISLNGYCVRTAVDSLDLKLLRLQTSTMPAGLPDVSRL